MEGYEPSTYGDRIAEIYDDWYSVRLDPSDTLDLLVELAAGGTALELGVGTGRVAIPLAARGVEVMGIDASAAMAEKLRAKPGGAAVEVVIGDFADVNIDSTFSLVYAPFTTFFALNSQEEQIRCLRNVATHLQPGGWFVLDAFVPDPARFDHRQRVEVEDVGVAHVLINMSTHDPLTQRVESMHVVLTEVGVRLYPVVLRYAWPAELDVMAMLAGLTPAGRYNGYDRRPFRASSTHHVSLYRIVLDAGR